ncbi:MAG TPA: histidinol dehydrogenase, partial [Enhygromyxa sp.]|nr:histidinol dehydrogenase [Enhygromyxa sp.]
VRRGGDAAIVELTQRFEKRTLAPGDFELSRERVEAAHAGIDVSLRAALEHAADRVRRFHIAQAEALRTTGQHTEGERLQSRLAPLARVAVYAPGGTAAYPSSVLHAAIPAKVASVDEVILFTPRPSEVVLAAAWIAQVDRVFQIGGAQAIAAAAYGTNTIPRVDKIVGPGNAYVTAAKRLVFGRCDIDSIAGPSEILGVADHTADPEIVAADLISQAEHDTLASPVLLTTDPALAQAVNQALVRQLATLPRSPIATAALRDQGAAVLVGDRAALVREADAYAAEHLELLVERPAELAEQIRRAGAIFVGPWTPEAAGDYTAGPSHVLPTAGGARFSSPLGVWDFVRYTSVLELGPTQLRSQAATITALARAEGLEGHARAVELRTGSWSEEEEAPKGRPTDWRRHLRPTLGELDVYDVEPSQAPARMHANECPEAWPLEVREALAQVVCELELNRYPDTSGRTLRRVLAERHRCDPDRIVLGNGSDEIIAMLLTALSGAGPGHLVIPCPTFVMYAHGARVLGMDVREVLLTDTLELDEPAMREALQGAAICFFARPNNPTSSLWSGDLIRALIRDYPDTVFVIDEAYAAYDPGCSLWDPACPSNQVHMGTLSKVGLAALRVGYCITDPELALALNKIRHPYNVSQTSIALAEAALTRFAPVQERMIAKTIENRGRLLEILRRLPDAELFPAHGNLVLVRFPSDERARALVSQLGAAGVRVKDVTAVPKLAGCLRISVGTDEDLDRLAAALG